MKIKLVMLFRLCQLAALNGASGKPGMAGHPLVPIDDALSGIQHHQSELGQAQHAAGEFCIHRVGAHTAESANLRAAVAREWLAIYLCMRIFQMGLGGWRCQRSS